MSGTLVASCAAEKVVLAYAPCMMLTWADSQRRTLQVEASCMDDDFGEGALCAAPAKPRRRQYRVKAV